MSAEGIRRRSFRRFLLASILEDVLFGVGSALVHLGQSVAAIGGIFRSLSISTRVAQYDAARDYRNVSHGELSVALGFPAHLTPPEAEGLEEYEPEEVDDDV